MWTDDDDPMHTIRTQKNTAFVVVTFLLVAVFAIILLTLADTITDHEPPTFDCAEGDLLVIHPDDEVECVHPDTLKGE